MESNLSQAGRSAFERLSSLTRGEVADTVVRHVKLSVQLCRDSGRHSYYILKCLLKWS